MAGGKPVGKLVAGVLAFVALAGVGFAVALVMGSQRTSDARVIGAAESHFAAAMAQAKTISSSVEGATGDKTSEKASAEQLEKADAAVKSGRSELDSARASIRQLESSEGRTLYLTSIDSAASAFDSLAELVAFARTTTEVYARMNEAADLASAANEDLNAAVTAGNKGDYSVMKSKGASAREGFKKAAKLFDEAQEIDPTSGLKYSAEYSRLREDQAELVTKMAADGKAGRLDRYNDGVAQLQKLDAKADKVKQPAIVTDPQLAARRIDELNAAITTAASSADEQHGDALAAFGLAK